MGHHEADVPGGEPGVGESEAHGARLAFGMPGGHVVGVGGDTGPGQPGVYARAAGLGEVGAFQNDHGRALTDHEAVPGPVEGPGSPLWSLVAGGVDPRLGEACEGEGVQARLCAARHHDIGAAEPDQVHAQGDGLGTGGAGADRGMGTSPGAQLQTDGRRWAVGHEHGYSPWGDPTCSGTLPDVVLAQQGEYAA